jgi:predicted O-methyltransferase YrrM
MKQMIRIGMLAAAYSLALGLAIAQPPPGRPGGRGGRDGFGGRGPQGFASAPLARDEAEKKILDVVEAMQKQGLGMSVPRDDGRLLRMLTESINAKHVVELGTFHGYSGIWFCLALRTTGGKLTTLEIDPRNAEISRENFKRAGVESLVTLIEGDAHKELGRLKEPVDLVFIDADKEGYLDYFNKLLPLTRPGGLIVAHNISSGMADPAFVKAITSDKSVDTIFVNAGSGGISVSLKKR